MKMTEIEQVDPTEATTNQELIKGIIYRMIIKCC